ncbi:MAG: ABC transporter ATP-binding protein [Acidimicrobiia bacterium]
MGRVSLQGVTKKFGDVVAVDHLDLEVADREFLVLLGPSGCGKSTALRMIAGLEELTEGTITIGDRVVNDVEPKDRDLAMVFQSYALYPHLSVRKNIEFPLRTRGVPKETRAATVADAADSLGLTGLLDRKPGQLSGGQRQRVALARAIVRDPEAFLMDEPLSNLDAKLRVETRAELVELQQRLAATVIYVTHDQVEAMTMGDRIAVMSEGVLQQVGPPQEVYARPANLFVARFIGTPPMNTIPGAVAGANADVVVGVRPEHVTVGARGSGIDATVALIESLGHERHVICRLVDGSTVIARQRMDVAPPDANADVGLAFAPGDVHHFDAAGGARLG